MKNNVWVILAAAGSGERLGEGIPKAFVKIGEFTILQITLNSLSNCGISNVIVALPQDSLSSFVAPPNSDMNLKIVNGGARRQDSVLNAAQYIPQDAEVVLVHDGARPFIVPSIISELIVGAVKFGSCMPVLPCADTLKRVSDGRVTGTVDREGVYSVQTPQAFRADVFRKILELYTAVPVTDDCAVLELAGYKPHTVLGSPLTFKITTPDDLDFAKLLLKSGI